MKLLLYSHAFAPTVGGIETIVASLARGLSSAPESSGDSQKSKTKIEVTVVTQTSSANFDDTTFPFPVVRQPTSLTLAQLIRNSDLVHIANAALPPIFLSWLLRKPFVIEHHGYQAICPNGLLLQKPQNTVCPGHFQAGNYRECIRCQSHDKSQFRSILSVLANFPRHALAKRAAANIAVSQHVVKRISLPRTELIYHGLPCDPTPPAITTQANAPAAAAIATSTSTSTSTTQKRFGYVGRFVPEKGIPILLDAAQQLRNQRADFEIILVGDGPQRPQIDKQIQDANAGDYVRTTGFLSGEKLAASVNSLDVVVMPSTWEETAGLAAMEQMARGRLVIASDIGGLSEIVGDTALKFPPGDAARLAEQMNQLLQHNEQFSELGKLARDRICADFREDRMIAEHLALYSRLV